MQPIETIEYKGFNIEVHTDEDAPNPCKDFDMFCTMACSHRNYSLGHEQLERREGGGVIWDEEARDVAWCSKLYLFDHSGITISMKPFSCPWDSGQVGWVYVTHEALKEMFKKGKVEDLTDEEYRRMKSIVAGEVETYDQCLRGDVYGWVVDYPNGTSDSCWGYFGHDFKENGLLDAAEGSIDCYIETERKKVCARTKRLIKAHVPLIHRSQAGAS